VPSSSESEQLKKCGAFDGQDEGMTVLRNIGNHSLHDTMPHPSTLNSSSILFFIFKLQFQ